MRVNAMAVVNGVDSRVSNKDGKTYNKVHLFLQGEDMGAMECNVPNDKPDMLKLLRESGGKVGKVVLNIRIYKGSTFVDCVGFEANK